MDTKDAGRKGGLSVSKKKQEAAKRNGKLGGRPVKLKVKHHSKMTKYIAVIEPTPEEQMELQAEAESKWGEPLSDNQE